MPEGNAYGKLLKLIKQQGYNRDLMVKIGKVSDLSPLSITLNGYEITEGDFFITNTAKELTFALEDLVLIIVDDNDFYVIDKVVET